MPASIKLLKLAAAKTKESAVNASFALWEQDQLVYSVKILECDVAGRKCKVEFDDGFKGWMQAESLHLELDIDTIPEELIVCALCDGDESKSPNELVICDDCHQGYHVRCHKPNVPRKSIQDENVDWHCATCNRMADQAKNFKTDAQEKIKSPKAPKTSTPKSKIPTKQKINLKHEPRVKGPAKVKISAKSVLPTPAPSVSPSELDTSEIVNKIVG